MTNQLRIIICTLLLIIAGFAMTQAGHADDALPFCRDIDDALLDAWEPGDAPICCAEDDPCWVPAATPPPITAAPAVTG